LFRERRKERPSLVVEAFSRSCSGVPAAFAKTLEIQRLETLRFEHPDTAELFTGGATRDEQLWWRRVADIFEIVKE